MAPWRRGLDQFYDFLPLFIFKRLSVSLPICSQERDFSFVDNCCEEFMSCARYASVPRKVTFAPIRSNSASSTAIKSYQLPHLNNRHFGSSMQRHERSPYDLPDYPLPYFSTGYCYGCPPVPPPSAYAGCLPPLHHYPAPVIQPPRDIPSSCDNHSDEDERLSTGSSNSSHEHPHLFRPVDFDNCASSPYYPPTPSDSESGAESGATVSPDAQSSVSRTSISVSLVEEEMWEAFGVVGNEMIVTKPGR